MDYKYIEQLLERYWQCETSLKEEEILRSFFMQEEVPAWLLHYKPLFTQEKVQPLGDDFDERIMSMTRESLRVGDGTSGMMSEPVRAKTISLTHRLMPLFKAAAIVAIVLTLGNAAQAPWDKGWDDPKAEYAKYHSQKTDSTDILPMQAERFVADPSTAEGGNLNDSTIQTTGPVVPTY